MEEKRNNDINFDMSNELNRLIIANVFINKLRDFKAIYGVRNLVKKEFGCTLEEYIYKRYNGFITAKNMFSELIPLFLKEENKNIAEKKTFDSKLLNKINLSYLKAFAIATNTTFNKTVEVEKEKETIKYEQPEKVDVEVVEVATSVSR